MKTLTNKSAVRALALHVSKAQRNGKFTRVSPEFLERIEAATRATVTDLVMRSGGGKTLTP